MKTSDFDVSNKPILEILEIILGLLTELKQEKLKDKKRLSDFLYSVSRLLVSTVDDW